MRISCESSQFGISGEYLGRDNRKSYFGVAANQNWHLKCLVPSAENLRYWKFRYVHVSKGFWAISGMNTVCQLVEFLRALPSLTGLKIYPRFSPDHVGVLHWALSTECFPSVSKFCMPSSLRDMRPGQDMAYRFTVKSRHGRRESPRSRGVMWMVRPNSAG